MLNSKSDFTYISTNGNSTIDLIFANIVRYTKEIKIEKSILRKHQPVILTVEVPHTKDKPKILRSRKVDLEKLVRYKAEENPNQKAFTANTSSILNCIKKK